MVAKLSPTDYVGFTFFVGCMAMMAASAKSFLDTYKTNPEVMAKDNLTTLLIGSVVAFIVAVFLCFFFYFGFEGLASLTPSFSTFISAFGMQDHFKSMGRGVIDTRDLLYFTSITVLFLSFTVYKLKSFKL